MYITYKSAPLGLTIRGYMIHEKIHMHSFVQCKEPQALPWGCLQDALSPPGRYRAIVHDSVSGCYHFRVLRVLSWNQISLDVRSPETIIGADSDPDHVVSSKRFLPERLINRGTAVRDRDKSVPISQNISLGGPYYHISSRPLEQSSSGHYPVLCSSPSRCRKKHHSSIWMVRRRTNLHRLSLNRDW